MLKSTTKAVLVPLDSGIYHILKSDGWIKVFTLVQSEAFGTTKMVKLERKP